MKPLLLLAVLLPQDRTDEKKEEKKTQEKEKEVVVTSSPFHAQDVFDTPWSADVVRGDDLQLRRLSRTIPEALKEVPGVNVQKTSNGHGSPFIRGFTGFRNVFLIDGIRLNNSIFREGPNQYWNTVDEFLIDRLEIVRGPSSVLHGSDSIGGTVVAYTKDPPFEKEFNFHGRAFYRFASAEDSHTAREEVWGSAGDWAWHGGFTYRDFGDVTAGSRIGEQPKTGYNEWAADVKVVHRFTENLRLVVAAQHMDQQDVPRTHRTFHSKEWHGTVPGKDAVHEFDQERDLVYAQLHAKFPGGFIDALQASVSLHRVSESLNRVTTETGATKTLAEVRDVEVFTPALFVQAGKETSIGYFTGGFDLYHDIVDSSGHDRLVNGTLRSLTRGDVADDATYTLFGLYLQDELTLGKFDLTAGIRFSLARMDADTVDPDPAGNALIPDSISDTYTAVTGSFRALYHLTENWNLIAGWGMGFRAPSLDDSTTIKLVLSGDLDIPAEGLDPERTHTFDLGVRARYDKWEAGAFAFYTILDDFIRRVPATSDFNGDGKPDNTKDNFAGGWVYGFEVYALYRITDHVLVWGDVAYVKGEADALLSDGSTSSEPLDKVNPMTAHLGVRFEKKDWGLWIEGVGTFVRHQEHLGPGDQTDTGRIPPGGTPGFSFFTIRAGYRFCPNASVTLSVENLTNKDYRWHGSGQNEPGTNAIVGLDVRL